MTDLPCDGVARYAYIGSWDALSMLSFGKGVVLTKVVLTLSVACVRHASHGPRFQHRPKLRVHARRTVGHVWLLEPASPCNLKATSIPYMLLRCVLHNRPVPSIVPRARESSADWHLPGLCIENLWKSCAMNAQTMFPNLWQEGFGAMVWQPHSDLMLRQNC